MKSALTAILIGALGITLGCNESVPGGPGSRSPDNRSVVPGATKKETFRISAPATTTTLKQGEQKEVEVSIERSSDFKQDVTLTFSNDKGVSVTPATAGIKASDSDTKVKVMLTASKDAPIGEATIRVTAKPESGDSTSADFKVNIKGS